MLCAGLTQGWAGLGFLGQMCPAGPGAAARRCQERFLRAGRDIQWPGLHTGRRGVLTCLVERHMGEGRGREGPRPRCKLEEPTACIFWHLVYSAGVGQGSGFGTEVQGERPISGLGALSGWGGGGLSLAIQSLGHRPELFPKEWDSHHVYSPRREQEAPQRREGASLAQPGN